MKHTTVDEFAAFDRNEKYYQIAVLAIRYIAIVAVSAFIGVVTLSPPLLKSQCEAQSVRNGSTPEACVWSTLKETEKSVPAYSGYLF